MIQNIIYKFNDWHLPWVATGLRFLLHHVLWPLSQEKSYSLPGGCGGYKSWVEVNKIGVLAFRTTEGQLEYRW